MNDALHIPDRVLVRRLIQGDAEAAALFVTRFSQLVWAVLVRDFRLPPDQCDDLFQDVFLHLWEDDYRRVRHWKQEGSFASYLAPIVRHLAIDRLRARAPERENPIPDAEDHEHPCAEFPSQEELTWLEEQRRAVEQALTVLPARDRELYRLRYVEELPYIEIAAELDVTVNNVGVRLNRLTRQLREIALSTGMLPPVRTTSENTARSGASVRTPVPGSSPDWK